jgi:uncharacterized protein YraI
MTFFSMDRAASSMSAAMELGWTAAMGTPEEEPLQHLAQAAFKRGSPLTKIPASQEAAVAGRRPRVGRDMRDAHPVRPRLIHSREHKMMKLKMKMKYATGAAVGAAIALAAVSPAQAQTLAYASQGITMRAGPDASYPAVAYVPPGAQVAVQGCLSGYSWCDVTAGYERGWVWAAGLNYPYRGRYVALPSIASVVGLGILSFALNDYWGEHYRSRPWYGQRFHYSRHGANVMGGPPSHWSGHDRQWNGAGNSGWEGRNTHRHEGRAHPGGHRGGENRHHGGHQGHGEDSHRHH